MTPKNKYRLFRNFFCGREDVYAYRVEGGGYRPRRAPKFQLTNRMLAKHMRGEVMLGAYPFLPNGRCLWVAADFDGHNGCAFEDAWQLAEALRSSGIEPVCNTSQSGKGVHVRAVFKKPLEVWFARRLLQAFIAYCELLPLNDGGAFDRLFPTQDDLGTNPKAIGNQIAMPFHTVAAQQRGGTLLLDRQFDTIPLGSGSWEYLDLYDRLTREDVVSAICDIDMEYLFLNRSVEQEAVLPNARRRGAHADIDKKFFNGTPEDLMFIVDNCELFQLASKTNLSYFEWIALASVLATFDDQGGRAVFHRLSSLDTSLAKDGQPRYDSEKTDKKYDNILKTMKPITCARLALEGWSCPELGTDGMCNRFRSGTGNGPRTPATILRFVSAKNAA